MEPEETEAQPAAPAHPAPGMDVVPPPAPTPAAEAQSEPEAEAADEQLHVAPPQNDTSDPASTMQLDEEHEHDPHQQREYQHDAQPGTQHEKSSSVTLAIVATIIIVLGLAALATYAFLQTQK